MIDPRLLRDPERRAEVEKRLTARDPELVAEGSAWARLAELDEERRRLQAEVDRLRAERNRASKEIGRKKAQGEDASEAIAAMRELGARLKAQEERFRQAEEAWQEALLELPNPPHPSVPIGADETENREVRRWGNPREEAPPHWEIAERLGWLDTERAGKLSGSRFSVLRGLGARLHRALGQFMLDLHTREHGYAEVWVPALVRADALVQAGQLPKFADELYRAERDDLYLIPTAEVPLVAMHAGEVLEAEKLPLRYAALTPCFRREAGSYGKDVRGLLRQHEFEKVELVWFVAPEEEARLAALEELVRHAARVLELLELPYRVVELCTGDLGFAAEKTYDIEVWMPGQGRYREISSCSSCGDFQARRAKIRAKEKGGKPRLVATLNGSGVAIGRCFAALLENHWDGEGVRIPEALRGYVGGVERLMA